MKASIVRKTYKSLLSKHCSQKTALLGGRTRRAEVDMVLGSPPVAPMLPAFRAGELMPPPHLFRPPPPQMSPSTVDPMNSIKPPLESDIALYVPRSPHRRSHTHFSTRIRATAIRFTARCAATRSRSTSLHRVWMQTRFMLLCRITGRRRDAYSHGWNVADRWRLPRKGKAAFTSPLFNILGDRFTRSERRDHLVKARWKMRPGHHGSLVGRSHIRQ